MTGIEVIVEDLKNHPSCPHGPTILFSRKFNGEKRQFFACSACRNRKSCSFFVYKDELDQFLKEKQKLWSGRRKSFVKGINHRLLFLTLNEVLQMPESERVYCQTCSKLEIPKFLEKHKEHKMQKSLSDYQLQQPSEFLSPLEDTKKEAQFLFSKSSVETIVGILGNLQYEKIICIGTPRIHEFITNHKPEMCSLLLDFDGRYHSFFGPLQFCWYNCFNNHFFFEEARNVFNDFLASSKDKLALVMDPPFGGRVEPLAQTVIAINNKYKTINKTAKDLPTFWVFPYFMEPQIQNSLPNFVMSDYKVDYDNHPLFKEGPKGRKYGSPVRIFTNISLSKIVLPKEEGYKFCKICQKWVGEENKHCPLCKACSSKDGRTYVHCKKCQRCVKPTWTHCETCDRCAQPNHKCGEINFTQECFHCKQPGHKKRDCPQVDHEKLQVKRKLKLEKSKRPKKQIKTN